MLLAATVGVARAQETGFGKYRGVWAGMKSEAVFTDSVMMYFHRDTLSGTGFGALRVPSRGIDMLTTFSKDTITFGKTPNYRIHATPDGALCIGGDTLMGLMAQLPAAELVPLAEPVPGAVLSRVILEDGAARAILTKSGGFGSRELLDEIHQVLNGGMEDGTVCAHHPAAGVQRPRGDAGPGRPGRRA